MDMRDIDIDRVERNIFCDFVEELWMGGKPETLKKVVHINVYRTN